MKKGQLFDISMMFVVIGAMVSILLVVTAIATETSPWKSISQRAFEIQNSYADGDYFVSFMSTGLRWTAAQAVMNVGLNGGFAENPGSGCGSFHQGFALWNTKEKPKEFCYPNAYESVYALLKRQLPAYTALYAQKLAERRSATERITVQAKTFNIPYEFLITGNRLLAIATAPLFLNILAPPEQFKYYAPADFFGLWTVTYDYQEYVTGVYVFRPNIEIPFDYNLSIYNVLAKTMQVIIDRCAAKGSTQAKKECAEVELIWQQDVLNEHLTITIDNDPQEQELFFFTLAQDDKKSVYADNKAPTIKFAFYLVAPETLPSEE